MFLSDGNWLSVLDFNNNISLWNFNQSTFIQKSSTYLPSDNSKVMMSANATLIVQLHFSNINLYKQNISLVGNLYLSQVINNSVNTKSGMLCLNDTQFLGLLNNQIFTYFRNSKMEYNIMYTSYILNGYKRLASSIVVMIGDDNIMSKILCFESSYLNLIQITLNNTV
jgi:hypothetical protein